MPVGVPRMKLNKTKSRPRNVSTSNTEIGKDVGIASITWSKPLEFTYDESAIRSAQPGSVNDACLCRIPVAVMIWSQQ